MVVGVAALRDSARAEVLAAGGSGGGAAGRDLERGWRAADAAFDELLGTLKSF